MSDRSILALELCVSLEPAVKLHETLCALIRQSGEQMSFQEKWQAYQWAARALLDHEHAWHMGCWDFFDETQKARSDFAMWVNGLLTEEGGRKEPSGAPDPYRGEPRYLTFTMAVLLVNGSVSERQLQRLCDIPEAHLWKRQTFQRLLGGLGYLSFSAVEADTMYVLPSQPGFALTAQDLTAPKFEYLRPIL